MIDCDGWQRNRKEAGLWEEEGWMWSFVPLTEMEEVMLEHNESIEHMSQMHIS